MATQFDDTIYQSVSDELDRTGYPEGFPALPEVPTARYTDKRMYDLEMEPLWRKAWLHACHISEFPNDGSYKLFEQVGLNVIGNRGPVDQIQIGSTSCWEKVY